MFYVIHKMSNIDQSRMCEHPGLNTIYRYCIHENILRQMCSSPRGPSCVCLFFIYALSPSALNIINFLCHHIDQHEWRSTLKVELPLVTYEQIHINDTQVSD